MTNEPIPLRKAEPPEDALDINSLWLDPKLGDGLINVHFHNIPFGKPRDFFRVCPRPEYRRLAEIITIKSENTIDEQTYIIDEPMWGVIEEARRATIVTAVYRDGSPRLWALKLPKDGEKDNEAWISARSAAKAAMDRWVKLVWVKRSYLTRDALPRYAPDPDYDKLPPFDELVKLAVGEHGIIRGQNHPVVLDLFGAPKRPDGDDDGLA